jgi:hypothetical protein
MVYAQCKTEKGELEILVSAFKNEIPAEPSAAVRIGFGKMLESEKQKTSKSPKIMNIRKDNRMMNCYKEPQIVSNQLHF